MENGGHFIFHGDGSLTQGGHSSVSGVIVQPSFLSLLSHLMTDFDKIGIAQPDEHLMGSYSRNTVYQVFNTNIMKHKMAFDVASPAFVFISLFRAISSN